MTKPTLPSSVSIEKSRALASKSRKRRNRKTKDNSDVLISAVISSYLLTHLHHVLQRAEFGAVKDGRRNQAANFAQLRKVLCMDARSMEDASASGLKETDLEQFQDSTIQTKVA